MKNWKESTKWIISILIAILCIGLIILGAFFKIILAVIGGILLLILSIVGFYFFVYIIKEGLFD